jgi:hypothetical protein
MLPTTSFDTSERLRAMLGDAGLKALRERFGHRARVAFHEVQKAIEEDGLDSTPAFGADDAAPSESSSDPASVQPGRTVSLVAALKELRAERGESNSNAQTLAWLHGLLDPSAEDPWVDTFAHMRPEARERATCWSQYANGRYCNNGRRIDYIVVTQKLYEAHAQLGAPLVEENDEDGALRAATASGRWLPASFAGGGLPVAAMPVHDTQFREPHTGALATAPRPSMERASADPFLASCGWRRRRHRVHRSSSL